MMLREEQKKPKWLNINDAWKMIKEDVSQLCTLDYIRTCINKGSLNCLMPSERQSVIRLFISANFSSVSDSEPC